MASSSPESATRLQHRGNTYSQLTSKQQSDIHTQVPLQCHSLETLKRSGVILDIDRLPQTIVQKQGLNVTDFQPTPNPSPAFEKRKAIVVTCQAAEIPDGGLEPVSICAIDFFTGQTLIDSFIAPSCEVLDWRTDVHGVSARTIETAVKGNNCLQTWREARMRLFEYVDAQTIFVGFAIWRDLEMLRVFHKGIVDAQVLAMDSLFTVSERSRHGLDSKWEIDRVCMRLLGIEMRAGAIMEKRVCDPYEDVLAAREIVLCFLQRPGDVVEWMKRERLEMFGSALKEEEGEDVVGKRANGARRGSKKTDRKESSSAKQEPKHGAKRNGNRKREQAAGARDSVVQSLRQLGIGEARRGSHQDGKQKPVKAAVDDGDHVETLSKNKEKSGNGQGKGKTTKKGKKKMDTEAQEKARIEASLHAMVREEERKLLTSETGKQGARMDWGARNRAERRAKWVDSQRED